MLSQDIITRNNSEKPAIFFEDEVLSYEDLDRLSNQFAHFFQSAGVGIELALSL